MRKTCVRTVFLFSIAIGFPSAILAVDKPEVVKPKADNKPSTQDADG
jgi:hypothetical protein